jgi:two-component system, LuxR family, sensor kinase FixL
VLKISAHRIDGGLIEIETIDSGPGIPADLLAKLFTPFTSTKSNGSAWRFTDRLFDARGGTIPAVNHPDGGAMLRLTLPTT